MRLWISPSYQSSFLSLLETLASKGRIELGGTIELCGSTILTIRMTRPPGVADRVPTRRERRRGAEKRSRFRLTCDALDAGALRASMLSRALSDGWGLFTNSKRMHDRIPMPGAPGAESDGGGDQMPRASGRWFRPCD